MTEKEFFDKLNQFVRQRSIQGYQKHNSYTYNNFATFGHSNGYPLLILSRENSIGCIDVYGFKYFKTNNENARLKQQEYMNLIVEFFEWCYIARTEGYILIKKSAGKYSTNPRDYLSKKLKKENYKAVHQTDVTSLFFDFSETGWAFYSPNNTREIFEKIFILYEVLLQWHKENKIKKVIGLHKARSGSSSSRITYVSFWYGEENYIITLVKSVELRIDLNFNRFKGEVYKPVVIYPEYIDLEKSIEELEFLNRLKKLIMEQ